MKMHPNPAYIELHFSQNVELIRIARRFVAEVCGRLLNDPDATSRVALATHELLENAVKYSLDCATTIRIEILQIDSVCKVSVRTRNRAAPDHVANLRQLVDGIAAAADPFVFYNALMRKNAARTEGSGLGLARICAEGEMTMRYELSGNDVTVIAQADVAEAVAL
jgi:hypothetical protein